jgi:hypothetical protein
MHDANFTLYEFFGILSYRHHGRPCFAVKEDQRMHAGHVLRQIIDPVTGFLVFLNSFNR